MHDYSERQTIRYLGMHMCLYGANTLNMNEPIKAGALVNTKTHTTVIHPIQHNPICCTHEQKKNKRTKKLNRADAR